MGQWCDGTVVLDKSVWCENGMWQWCEMTLVKCEYGEIWKWCDVMII